jgi:hypothetical protein
MIQRALKRISPGMYRFLATRSPGKTMKIDGTFRLAGRIQMGAECLWIFVGDGERISAPRVQG